MTVTASPTRRFGPPRFPCRRERRRCDELRHRSARPRVPGARRRGRGDPGERRQRLVHATRRGVSRGSARRRRWSQHETISHHGRRDDPLHRIHRLLLTGAHPRLAHSGRRCLTGVVGRRDEDATILLRRRRLNRLLHEDTSGRTAPDMLLVTCSTNDHMKCIRHRACYLRNIPVHLLRVTSLRNLVTETSPSRHLEFICTLSALSRILPRQQRVSWPARERQEARCTEGRDAGGFAQPP